MSSAEARQIFKKNWKPQQQAMAKYAQLVEVIQAAIVSEELVQGSRLPTETDFVKGTSFSLGTVQRAMRILTNRGVIERRQGVGTFVAKPSRRLSEPLQCRIFNDDRTGFLELYARVVDREVISGKGPWTQYLGDHVEKALRISRVLKIADEFSVVSLFYLDPARLGALEHIQLDQLHGTNFKELLEREFGLSIREFDQNLRVERFDQNIIKLLDCKAGTVGAVLEIVANADWHVPLYFQELYIPPNARTLFVSGHHHESLD